MDNPVPNSFHLSPWVGNQTPKELKADTATAIALRFIADKNHNTLFPHANIITSSHFNSDGLLAVFTLLYPDKAEPMAKTLIEVSEASDFSSFSSENGVQIHLLIEEMCHSEKSPLKKKWGSWFSSGQVESRYYKTLITEVYDIIEKKDQYRYLWEDRFNQITLSMEQFEKRKIGIEEYSDDRLSIIINDVRPAPQAIDYYCRGDMFLIVEDQSSTKKNGNGSYAYELCYRYYSWADTVRRPAILKAPLNHLADYLNKEETSKSGKWETAPKGQKPSSTVALTFSDRQGNKVLSTISPNKVTESVLHYIRKNKQ